MSERKSQLDSRVLENSNLVQNIKQDVVIEALIKVTNFEKNRRFTTQIE